MNILGLDHGRDGRVQMPLRQDRYPQNFTLPPRPPRSITSPVNIAVTSCSCS